MIGRFQVKTLKTLAKLPQKERNKSINRWKSKPFRDIKHICTSICRSPKIQGKTLKKNSTQKNNIRKISKSSPKKIKTILTKQKGKGIFTAIALGLAPLIINGITKLVKKK